MPIMPRTPVGPVKRITVNKVEFELQKQRVEYEDGDRPLELKISEANGGGIVALVKPRLDDYTIESICLACSRGIERGKHAEYMRLTFPRAA